MTFFAAVYIPLCLHLFHCSIIFFRKYHDSLLIRESITLETLLQNFCLGTCTRTCVIMPEFDESWNIKGHFEPGARPCRLAVHLLARYV